MKKWIRPAILALAFLATIIIAEALTNKQNTDLTASMEEATLPIVTFQYGDATLNELHGYTSARDLTAIRGTVTPIKDDRLLHLEIATYGQVINGISYEIRTINGERLVAEGSIDSYEQEGNTIRYDETVENILESGEEYSYCLCLKLDDRDVYYYTRILSAGDTDIDEAIAFATKFHDYTLNGLGDSFIPTYMDPATGDPTTLNYVDLSCTLKQITWADFEGSVISDVVVNVEEITNVYNVVILDYVMSYINEDGETEYYNVEEFYRLRLNEERMYVLNFERTMNQIFNGENTVLNDAGNLQLGIRDLDVDYKSSDSGDMIAFVQEGELWCYDVNQNIISRVFSFRDIEGLDTRENWNEHDIKIVNVDEAGSVNFIVYGYMNRGIHEGEVGVAVYHYDGLGHTIEEGVFVPSTSSYEVLKAELGQLLYVNDSNELFMTVGRNVYDISMDSMTAVVMVENVSSDSYCVSESGRYFAYISADEMNNSTSITFVDLKNKSTTEISEGTSYVRPLAFIDEDLIYGIATPSEVITDEAGQIYFPMNTIKILETSESGLTEVKNYSPIAGRVSGVSVESYVITVNLESLSGTRYVANGTDTIVNRDADTQENVLVTTTTTDVKETQVQLTVESKKRTRTKMTTFTVIVNDEETTLAIEDSYDSEIYFVYSRGNIVMMTDNLISAITCADESLGVVVDHDMCYLWKRAKHNYVDPMTGFHINSADLESDSVTRALSALFDHEGVGLSVHDLMRSGNSVEEVMKTVLTDKTILNVSGCSLEEALFYVSEGNPVFAMMDTDHAVLLTGYTGSQLYYYDSETASTQSMSLDSASARFENCGNVFIAILGN